MPQKSSATKLAGAGLLSAIAASLCCITPVLALISGASGAASAFSWLEPLRPFLIGITVLVLGFAWYRKLKPRPQEEIACDCEADKKKPSFIQSKLFLGIVTGFAVIMLAFPYYGQIFYPEKVTSVAEAGSSVEEVKFNITGMTCSSCEKHVEHAVSELPGILDVTASYDNGIAVVKFDENKTSTAAITEAIDATGYEVSGNEAIQTSHPH